MWHRFHCAVAVFVLFIGLCGCAKRVRISDIADPQPFESAAERSEFLRSLEQPRDDISTFRALARCQLTHGKESAAMRYLFAFERPDRLRVEQLPTTGFYTLSLLVSNGAEITFLDVSREEAYRGTNSADFLKRTMHLPLAQDDLYALLIGKIPARELSLLVNGDGLVGRGENGSILIKIKDAVMALDGKALREYHRFDPSSGKEIFSIHYHSNATYDGKTIPNTWTIHLVEDDAQLACRAETVKINEPVKPELFQASIPGNFSVKSLD